MAVDINMPRSPRKLKTSQNVGSAANDPHVPGAGLRSPIPKNVAIILLMVL